MWNLNEPRLTFYLFFNKLCSHKTNFCFCCLLSLLVDFYSICVLAPLGAITELYIISLQYRCYIYAIIGSKKLVQVSSKNATWMYKLSLLGSFCIKINQLPLLWSLTRTRTSYNTFMLFNFFPFGALCRFSILHFVMHACGKLEIV